MRLILKQISMKIRSISTSIGLESKKIQLSDEGCQFIVICSGWGLQAQGHAPLEYRYNSRERKHHGSHMAQNNELHCIS